MIDNPDSKIIHRKKDYWFIFKKCFKIFLQIVISGIAIWVASIDELYGTNGKILFYIVSTIVTLTLTFFIFRTNIIKKQRRLIFLNISIQLSALLFLAIYYNSEMQSSKKTEIETAKVEPAKVEPVMFTYEDEVSRISSCCERYLIRLKNYNGKDFHIFISNINPEVPITLPGDTVKIKANITKDGYMNVIYFNNLDIYTQGENEESNVTK